LNCSQEIDEITVKKKLQHLRIPLKSLKDAASLIGRNTSLLFNLNSAETSDALQQTTQQASPF